MNASTGTTLIGSLKEAGIGIAAIVVIAYLAYLVIMFLIKYTNRVTAQHEENMKWFKGFVDENNHQKTDVIREATESIQANTAVLKQIHEQNTIMFEKQAHFQVMQNDAIKDLKIITKSLVAKDKKKSKK